MDLKHLCTKIDLKFKKYKKNKLENINEFFNIVLPIIESYPKIKGNYDPDFTQDFVVYIYQRFETIVSKYNDKYPFCVYFYKVLKNSFLNFIKFKKRFYVSDDLFFDSVKGIVREQFFVYDNIYADNINTELDYEEHKKYKEIIDKILNFLNEEEKVIFLLYNYEIIDGKWLIFLSQYLNVTPIELNNIILEFREKNLQKYKRKELLFAQLVKCNSLKRKEELKKQIDSMSFLGSKKRIAELLNLSYKTVKIKFYNINKKLKKIANNMEL